MKPGGTFLRMVAGALLCIGIITWDQSDGETELPFLGATFIALIIVYGVSGLAWYIQNRSRGRE